MRAFFLLVLLSVSILFFTNCEDSPRVPFNNWAGDGGTGPDGDTDADTDVDADADTDTDTDAVRGICGDGQLTADEACDDSNVVGGDGCATDCRMVEEGWSCAPPGMACHQMAKCGDGQVLLPEMCDDDGNLNGDGCSSTCKIEIGYKCTGSPSVCEKTVCGDRIMEGAETCDDGNTEPFDGCNAICQAEPVCGVGVPCTNSCGDGMVLGEEECDDGNGINGDGCSSDCHQEPGFTCTQEVVLGESMTVPIILRDFRITHDDFEFPGEKEGDLAWGLEDATLGLVETTLGPDKKPRFTKTEAMTNAQLIGNGLIKSATTFDTWYRTLDPAATVVSELKLFDDDNDGSYVNRYTLSGQMWERLNVEYEGNPVFFPMDELGVTPTSEYFVAKIPPNYFGMPEGTPVSEAETECTLGEGCNPCWPIECITGDDWADPGGDCAPEGQDITWYDCYDSSPRHNFHFTTQVGYWFEYDASKTYKLSFVGDDDLWVFVNGKLVLDLGGIHVALEKEVNINTAPGLDLIDGEVYDIMVFHAERQTYASTYKLTLSGFGTARSECLPTCGDGIVAVGEECDDGVNDGGYGECAQNCVLDAYCGDGIQQEGESCDDGNFYNDDDCPSSCRIINVI